MPPRDVPHRPSLADQVYDRIKAELHDFALVPGDRIAEAEVALRLGVSRTPVREALFRLRNEGFLEVEAKMGWFVLPLDFARLDELYDLRTTLELAAVTKLCSAPDSAERPEMQALKSRWLIPKAERPGDPREVGALDEEFHATLVRAAGNREAARVHWDVTERIRIVRRLDFTRPDRIDATFDEHARILRAVIQRKPDQAQLLLKSHIEQSKVEVRKISLHAMHEARQRAAGRG